MSLLALLAGQSDQAPPQDPPVTIGPLGVTDDFTGDGPLSGRATGGGTTWTAPSGWATSGGQATVAAMTGRQFAIAGHADQDFARIGAKITPVTSGTPGLLFRYQDASNHARLDVDVAAGFLLVVEVAAGVERTVARITRTLAYGTPIDVLVDLYTDTFTVHVDGADDARPWVFWTAHNFATRTGYGLTYTSTSTSGSAQFDDFRALETTRVKLNWPRFHTLGTRVFPDVALGPTGAWDSTDINNPNVVPNPAGGWVMSYTGHRNGGPDGSSPEVQEMGLAYATTLDGPWTKDPQNPAFTDPNNQKWNINGGLARSAGVWVQCYGTGANAGTVGIATSTDLHTWTILPTIGTGHDCTARLADDGVTVEVYYKSWAGNSIYRRTSSDQGATWTPQELVIAPPSWFPAQTPQFSEVGIYVPPGQEGVQMLAAIDRLNPWGSWGRESLLGITVDGGATWQWTIANTTDGTTGGGDRSRFDPYLEADGQGGFYLYYCGSDINTPTLDGGLQIGHRRITWDPATLVRT